MRISDWSSDVCSSDLCRRGVKALVLRVQQGNSASERKIVGCRRLKFSLDALHRCRGGILDAVADENRLLQLDILVVIVECRDVQPQPAIEKIGLQAHFIGVDDLRIVAWRDMPRWTIERPDIEKVETTALVTAVVAYITHHTDRKSTSQKSSH